MENNRELIAHGAVQMFFWGLDGRLDVKGVDINVITHKETTIISAETPKFGTHYCVKILHSESNHKFIKEIHSFCELIDDKQNEIRQDEAEADERAYESYVDSVISELKIDRMS